MQSNRLLLTIAIPTYNGGDNLIRAIQSCKYVDLPPEEYEILIVDNCSSDGSIEKVQELTSYFQNIRLYRNEKNIGRIGNWNRCLDLAQGRYLLFLFSNDSINRGFSFKKIIEIALSENYPTVMFNTLHSDGPKSRVFYHYIPGRWGLKDFIERYFVKNMASLGILQSHLFDLSLIKKKNIRFNSNIDRTTDRVFIFDVINFRGYFYFVNEVGTVWFPSKNRYHYSVHLNVENINPEDLYKYFYDSWIQEMIADFYILKNIGYDDKIMYKIFFTYIMKSYYINSIRFLLKRKYTSIDEITLDIFSKYLERYGKLKEFPVVKLKTIAFLEALYHIIKKVFKRII
ncbi:MAG: glycosyltransferase family 2 protein [Sulfurihydrogenibium sp.]|jgi:glycosyltransferase involved in cell wall biosynthesis|nr:glycosyltransferase family 2 protein [Sulfurihydrogenibium sp.]